MLAQLPRHAGTATPPCCAGPPQVSGYGRQNYLREGGAFPRVTPDQIEESVNKSLERLGTDYVDLLQIHWRVMGG